MAYENYPTEDILVRANVLNSALFVAGTYKKGELLGQVTASGAFTTFASGASDGSQIIAAVCPQDVEIGGAVTRAAVANGEFSRKGVTAVMASLATPVTVNDAIVGQCWDAGIILN